MKRLLALVIVLVVGYLGYTWYRTQTRVASPASVAFSLNSKPLSGNLLNVLGTTTSNLFAQTTALLNSATDGAAEPLINKTVSDLQERIKDLPQEQYDKVKYEFCKDVVSSYKNN